MMFNHILLLLSIIISHHTIYSITTISFGTWVDDYNTANDGWVSPSTPAIVNNANTGTTYHGFWNIAGDTNLYRHFNIATWGKLSISFSYIYGCDPESENDQIANAADYAYLTYGTTQSAHWSWDNNLETSDDSAFFFMQRCTANVDGQQHGWIKKMSFSNIYLSPTDPYEINFNNYQSATNEYWGVTDIKLQFICLTVDELQIFNDFNVNDIQELQTYLSQISTFKTANCSHSAQTIKTKITELKTAFLETKYGIQIAAENSNENSKENSKDDNEDNIDSESNYFSITPLTPHDFKDFTGTDIEQQDIEAIAEIFDAQLDEYLSSYRTDMTEDELKEFCPKINDVYTNIAAVQRRLLITIDPSTENDNSVTIEKDNFCSYTNRIATDTNNDGDFEINIQNTVIKVPYMLINRGRTDWKNENMDSIDITILCMDNILVDDCNQFIANDNSQKSDENVKPVVYGNFGYNIDIYSDDYRGEFKFMIPFSGVSDDIACGWIENIGDDWDQDGCTATIIDGFVECECNHRTVFNLISDLRTGKSEETVNDAKALQIANIYLVFLVVYSILALAATYLVVTLYRIKDIKKLASIIISVITLQIYSHVIQYIYLSSAPLETVPLGVTFCIISIPLLCHFWVCSLLILHWMKIFECAKTFNSNNKSLDYTVISMNIVISIVFIALLIAAMLVPRDTLPSIIAASNGILGIVGISICIAWFYFGYKTSTILMKSADNIKDSCADALDEALTLRRRLLRLTFIIGLCFFTQSMIAILSIIEHLQLFSEHFVNFTTIWAICDVIIFITFILFYKTHVLRQKKMYKMEQEERKLERAAKRKKRDGSSTHKSNQSDATIRNEQSQSYGIMARFSKARNSIFGRDDSNIKRNQSVSTKSKTNSTKTTKKSKSFDTKSCSDYQKPTQTITQKKSQKSKKNKHKPKEIKTHLPALTLNVRNSENCTPTDVILVEMPEPELQQEPPTFNHQNSRFSVASNSTITTIGSNDSLKKRYKSKHRPQFSQDDSYVGMNIKPRKKHNNNHLDSLTLQNHNRMTRSRSRSNVKSNRSKSQDPFRDRPMSVRSNCNKKLSMDTPTSPSVEKVKYGKRKNVKAIPSYTPKMTSSKSPREENINDSYKKINNNKKKIKKKKKKIHSKDDNGINDKINYSKKKKKKKKKKMRKETEPLQKKSNTAKKSKQKKNSSRSKSKSVYTPQIQTKSKIKTKTKSKKNVINKKKKDKKISDKNNNEKKSKKNIKNNLPKNENEKQQLKNNNNEYDDNEIDNKIEKAMHEATNSWSYNSINSLKDITACVVLNMDNPRKNSNRPISPKKKHKRNKNNKKISKNAKNANVKNSKKKKQTRVK